jgi:phospholipase C
MHPGDGSPLGGDDLVAKIYNAIRSNPTLWENTVFLITFDEHGGLWDSVMPQQRVVNPDSPWVGTMPTNPPGTSFDFTRLGVRVPAILVSAWCDASLDSTVYEHASIPATIIEQFGLTGPGPGGFLTKRDQAANTFLDKNMTRDTPRTDVVALPVSVT